MQLKMLWLELTGRCQLVCRHCYAESGPDGGHGVMSRADWLRVIDEAAELGVGAIQFIGGEPTLHPDLELMVERARGHGIAVEVYSNLVHVPQRLWGVFTGLGVRIATSYYTPEAGQHGQITGRPTLARTRSNIARAVELGLPVRAGVIRVLAGQDVDAAVDDLRRLGVARIGLDDMRGVGRGAGSEPHSADALCGKCARGRLVVTPTGDAYPCVFARWPAMRVGTVRTQALADLLAGAPAATVRKALQERFDQRLPRPAGRTACRPDGNGSCDPSGCTPSDCSPDCAPKVCTPLEGDAEELWRMGCDPDWNGESSMCGPDL